jgi:hypothetical protein
MKRTTIITVGAVSALVFGVFAIYISIGWVQNFIPEVEVANFIFLIVFTGIGLVCVSVGLAILWELIKKAINPSNK